MLWVGLGCMIVTFPDYTHLLLVHASSEGSGDICFQKSLAVCASQYDNGAITFDTVTFIFDN